MDFKQHLNSDRTSRIGLPLQLSHTLAPRIAFAVNKIFRGAVASAKFGFCRERLCVQCSLNNGIGISIFPR